MGSNVDIQAHGREVGQEIARKGREVQNQLDNPVEVQEKGYFISSDLLGTVLSTLSALPYSTVAGLIPRLATLSKLEDYCLVEKEPEPVVEEVKREKPKSLIFPANGQGGLGSTFSINDKQVQYLLNLQATLPVKEQTEGMSILNSLDEL